jgi:hypothetical protein
MVNFAYLGVKEVTYGLISWVTGSFEGLTVANSVF